jgi:glycosyltransferase involved in cell wall biosynthesis
MSRRGASRRPGAIRVLSWPAFYKQSSNPHAALLCAALREQGVEVEDWTPGRALLRRDVDLWHLHHPDTVVYPRSRVHAALGTLLFALLLTLARRRGTRILWTVHDLGNNDGLHPGLEARFWPFFAQRVDGYVGLTEGGRQQALARFPALGRVAGFVCVHGHYRGVYPIVQSRQQARVALGLPLDATVILSFGLLRPYKNVPHLIDIYRRLPRDERSLLLVAGRPFDARVERSVRERAEGCLGVRLDLRWIPPAEVQPLFAASDLVALPYRRVLNSGATLLALSLGRPVLVPDLGAMREQQDAFGSDWVRIFEGDLTADALSEACAWARDRLRHAPDLSGRDWSTLARQTRAIYARVIAQATARRHADPALDAV